MRQMVTHCACALLVASVFGCLQRPPPSEGQAPAAAADAASPAAAAVNAPAPAAAADALTPNKLAPNNLVLNNLALNNLAPNATGLCLAEVVDIVSYDARASDGNAGLSVKLRKLKGTGEFRDVIDIITAYGGGGPGPPPKPPDFLRPGTFEKGGQYWIAFASPHEYEKHPQGVVNFWRKGQDAQVEAALDEAVRADVYRWSPRYDPTTKLVYGRMNDETAQGDAKRWRIQVQRAGEVLWEKTIQGTMASWSPHSWKLDESAPTNFPGKVPPCGKMLLAETAIELEPENEFGLPPQPVTVQTGYDPETGARLTAKVMRHEGGYTFTVLYREYDPKTGEVEKETR